MIVVGIETSTPRTSVAIGTEVEILGAISVAGRARQESVTPALDQLRGWTGIELSHVGGVAVGIGPGLFTGLRVGIETAKTLAQVGKMLGVKYLIVGSVTKFGTEKSNKSFGGGGFGAKYGVGNVGTSKGKANVAIAARMIDTTTGEIMASAKGEGTSKRSGLLLEGGAGGYGGAGMGHINFGASEFRDTILGEATEAAVKMTADKLIAAKGRLSQ